MGTPGYENVERSSFIEQRSQLCDSDDRAGTRLVFGEKLRHDLPYISQCVRTGFHIVLGLPDGDKW